MADRPRKECPMAFIRMTDLDLAELGDDLEDDEFAAFLDDEPEDEDDGTVTAPAD